jgi:hypothetical protein
MTSAAKANRNAEIVDRLEAENTRLQTALGYHANELQEARRQAIRDATEPHLLPSRLAAGATCRATERMARSVSTFVISAEARSNVRSPP